MRTRFALLRAVFWASVTWLACNSAFAMRAHQDCRDPSVFQGADVNIVVLPYVSTGTPSPVLNELGQRLALLIKLDAFAHVLNYGSLGATQMEVTPGADVRTCIPQVVIPKLLGQVPGASILTPKGKGLIIVWGVLYEEGDDIIIQSYARFVRPETSESIGFQVAQYQFSAQPSSQVVAFTPRALKKSLLAQVEASYRRADLVHKEPRDDSEGEPLPHPVAKCIECAGELTPGYEVIEKKGEWIHVRWMIPESERQSDGWIHAAGSFAGESLDSVLPELHFIQGCVGYLMQRIAEARQSRLSKVLAAEAIGELKQYQVASESSDKTTSAVAQELSGIIQLLQSGEGVDDLITAQKSFDAALTLVPYDPDAATLASLTQIQLLWRTKNTIPSPLPIAERLTNAAALSLNTKAAVENLRNYLQLLLSAPPSVQYEGMPREAIRERLEVVAKVRVPSS
jgi:hypothetical protein